MFPVKLSAGCSTDSTGLRNGDQLMPSASGLRFAGDLWKVTADAFAWRKIPQAELLPGSSYHFTPPSMVIFQSGDEKIHGFLALPDDECRRRAVIAIHEWWGLNGWMKERATNLAANGYIVLAVDLYREKVTADPSEARKLIRISNWFTRLRMNCGASDAVERRKM